MTLRPAVCLSGHPTNPLSLYSNLFPATHQPLLFSSHSKWFSASFLSWLVLRFNQFCSDWFLFRPTCYFAPVRKEDGRKPFSSGGRSFTRLNSSDARTAAATRWARVEKWQPVWARVKGQKGHCGHRASLGGGTAATRRVWVKGEKEEKWGLLPQGEFEWKDRRAPKALVLFFFCKSE